MGVKLPLGWCMVFLFNFFRLTKKKRKEKLIVISFLETGDGLPGLAIDIYANFAQIQMYSLFWKPFLKFISESLIKDLGIKGIYVKHRIRGRPQVSRRILRVFLFFFSFFSILLPSPPPFILLSFEYT